MICGMMPTNIQKKEPTIMTLHYGNIIDRPRHEEQLVKF